MTTAIRAVAIALVILLWVALAWYYFAFVPARMTDCRVQGGEPVLNGWRTVTCIDPRR